MLQKVNEKWDNNTGFLQDASRKSCLNDEVHSPPHDIGSYVTGTHWGADIECMQQFI